MIKVLSAIALALFIPPSARSQTNPGSPAFESVSVKPGTPVKLSAAAGTKSTGSRVSEDPGRITYTNTTLMPVLTRAYGVKRRQINGPAWLSSETYDIAATIPTGALREQIPAMLQNLLAERFKMTVHVENRQERIYALAVGKNGPRFKESKAAEPSVEFDSQGHMKFTGYTLTAFADILTNILDRSVVDSTGLQGRFDFSTELDFARLKPPPDAAQQDAADPLPSTFTAVQELGLKLDARDGPVKHIVIDKAEKIPTAN